MSKDEFLHLAEVFLLPCLLPCSGPIFSRSRWAGSEAAIGYYGLLANSHGLLSQLFERWCGSGAPQEERESRGTTERTTTQVLLLVEVRYPQLLPIELLPILLSLSLQLFHHWLPLRPLPQGKEAKIGQVSKGP